MAPFETLYGSICAPPSGLFEVDEFVLIGPEAIYEAVEKAYETFQKIYPSSEGPI